jgi:hypothetical protein
MYDSHNDVTMSYYSPVPIISVEEFFHDDSNTPWKPLPEYDLKQSPCYPIIEVRNYDNYKIPFYYLVGGRNLLAARPKTQFVG